LGRRTGEESSRPAQAGEPGQGEVTSSAHPIVSLSDLKQAARTGALTVIAAVLLLAISDLRRSPDLLLEIYTINGLQIAVAVVAWWLVDRQTAAPAVRYVSLGCGTLECVFLASAGAITNDPAHAALLALCLVWGTAVLIPWGVGVQLAMAGSAGVALLLGQLLVRGELLIDLASYPAIATALALGASGLLAHQIEKQRLAAARAGRRQTEEAVQRGEERFRAFIEGSHDLVAVVDRHGVYRYVNPAHQAVFGMKAEELVGTRAFDRLHPDDAARILSIFAETVRGEHRSTTAECRFRHRDGSWVAFGGVALNLLDDPAVRGVLVTGRDLSQHQRVAEREALLQFAKDISRAHDLDKLLDSAQQRMARAVPCDCIVVFCWNAKEQAFRLVAEHGLSEELRAPMQELKFGATEPFNGALLNGEPILLNDLSKAPPMMIEIAERFDIGALIAAPLHIQGHHLGSVAMFRHRGGEPFEASQVDVCRGITDQLAIAIEALQLQDRQQQDAKVSAALARVGQELISSLDTAKLLDRLCHVTAEVLGCDSSYTIVRAPEESSFRLAGAHGVPPHELEAVRALSLPEEAFTGLLERLEANGVVHVDTSNAPSIWAALPARYTVGSVMYTALRRGDEIIGMHAAGFRDHAQRFSEQQERIACGIAELASLGLENARLLEEVERANQLKTEFLATMSHELLTPLNVIIGYADLLVDGLLGSLSTPQSEGIERMRVNARQLLLLIRQTLDLSRLESGRSPLEIVDVDVGDLVRQLDSETRDVQQSSGLDFAWSVPPALSIKTDPVKLHIVPKNLVLNAAKFTEKGTVTVEASEANADVEIRVRDTGIGIAAESLPFIFEPFRQADSSFRRTHSGVGLGLHIVRRLVDLLGGAISVDSTLGSGSVFRVRLPQHGPHGQPPRAGDDSNPRLSAAGSRTRSGSSRAGGDAPSRVQPVTTGA